MWPVRLSVCPASNRASIQRAAFCFPLSTCGWEQGSISRAAALQLGTGRSPKAGEAAGRTGWEDPGGQGFTASSSARKHPRLALGARVPALPAPALLMQRVHGPPQAGERRSLRRVKLQPPAAPLAGWCPTQ